MSEHPTKAVRFFTPDEAVEEDNDPAWDRARSAIEKLKRAYVEEWAPNSIDELERALKLASSNPEQAADQLHAAYRVAHDMKGQGATFGYALITDIGASLCELTYNRVEATAAEVRAMLAHVAAARDVLEGAVENPESAEASVVMGRLHAAMRANLH